ncbi:MAG: ThuA domain-containing protein [Planctomycetota bacterium]
MLPASLALTLCAVAPCQAQEPIPYDPPAEPLPAHKEAASDAAQEAIANFRVPEGTTVELVAAEPLLANPVAIEIDHQGRIYVAETYRQETEGVPDNRTFPEWLEDDLRLQTVEERAAMTLEHHPEFATEWTDRDDRISLLIDEDGDGVAESSRLFAHGFSDLVDGTGSGLLAVGNDVYYTCIPKLWKLTDADRDGVAESGVALHHGYGVRVAFRGHDMHGLVLGPMGKLYFSIGDRGYHVINQEGELLAEPGRGAVFRCNLDGSELEVFATGLRNPQELAFDDFGNLFTVDNNCDAGDRARLVHVLPQGDSGWSMNFQYLPDRGPWMSESWWKPASEMPEHPYFLNAPLINMTSGPSGLAAYPGVGLGPEIQGSFFVCDFLGGTSYSGIRRFTLEPQGASFVRASEEEYWWSILATDVTFAPDGTMVASDWVRGWIGEGFGRIYRARSANGDANLMQQTAAILAAGCAEREITELQQLLDHADRRVRFEAQWEIARRSDLDALLLIAMQEEASLRARCHAIWGLGMLPESEGSRQALHNLIAHAEEQIQIQALRAMERSGIRLEDQELAFLLQSESLQVRLAAVQLLGVWKAPAGIAQAALTGKGKKDRALVQAVAWATSESPADLKDWQGDPRVGVLAARYRKDAATLTAFLSHADTRIASEAAIAIYDLDLTEALPALAQSMQQKRKLPRPMLRRAAAANNRLGQAEHAANLLNLARSTKDDALRKEVRNYIRDWDRPQEFDPVLNESRTYGPRAEDWFVGKDLPFLTAKDMDAIERGKEVFTGHASLICTRCHSVRGVTPPGRPNPAGPELSSIGLQRSKEELMDSILNPSNIIVEGFDQLDADGNALPVSSMPALAKPLLEAGHLEQQQLDDLVAFLVAQKQQRHILVHVDSQGYEHAVAKANEKGFSLVERSWMAWAEADHRFKVTIDRGYDRFSDVGLKDFDAVFFYTTGELPMDEGQKKALVHFVEQGGVLAGSHCATDTFYQWPAFGEMLGGYFDGHPWHQKVQVVVEDAEHPSNTSLQSGFTILDEIYQFKAPYDRDLQHVLLSLDIQSVPMDLESIHRTDGDFALAWERAVGKGGVFYTALGHRAEIWRASWFRDHLVEGILAVCDAPPRLEAEPVESSAEGTGAEQEAPAASGTHGAPPEEIPASPAQTMHHEFAPGIGMDFAPVTMEDGSTLWVSTTEVPWEVYDLFFLREEEQVEVDGITGPSRSVFPVTRGFGHDGVPALGMTLHAAQEFCRWASLPGARRFRLPTESEWRTAAGPAPDDMTQVAWFAANAEGKPHSVATLAANARGLHDMFGNVAEWVAGDHEKGVVLGGSFLDDASKIGPTARATYEISWQQRDPQWPKSSWWMSDGGFAGIRLVTLDGPSPNPETQR